jgi:aspartyl-tRNA(Asn)/glutamyl-tRNA(Gln) amidotransferase subunit B
MSDLPYRVVIGLEVHVQLLTRTKLFCGCSTAFGLPPNSATCPVCLGLPGSLPVMNRQAFDLALRAAMTLNCAISPFTKWDRKNYYYPDLPKNYQISQYELPLGTEGCLEINTPSGPKKVGIIRVHLEEDAGKLLHDEQAGTDSLVDLNRTGTPLAEIVGKPELSSPEEARTYLETMAELMRFLGVSDCQMQEGSLRCDANVNIHVPQAAGAFAVTPIVEIKNLNSFRFLEAAVRSEAARQYEQWKADPTGYLVGKHPKWTAGFDEKRTFLQRPKEESADYRYFPEPDLVPVVVDDAWLARVRAEVGESPAATRQRLGRQYGLSEYDVGVLLAMGPAAVGYFEEAARVCRDPKAACNWLTNQVQATMKQTGGDLATFGVSAARLGGLICKQQEMGLNNKVAADVFARMLSDGSDADSAIAALGIRMTDDAAVAEIVRRAMAANAKAVADYKNGKAAAANAIKGAVMRETKGSVRADVVDRVLKEELEKA